ncbi:MAG TPA: hypothetical protein DCG47_04205 [Spirochaetaceae bacterium]|nr:hypothetical protein [Spirochaetaceae bacterium]
MHADDARSEDFRMHPGAFLGFIRILVVLFLISALTLPLAPILSAALMSVGMAILVLEFMLYKELIDPLYPVRTGRNVSAVLEPTGPVTRQILISGHHDSAHIFNFYVNQPEKYALRVYGGIGSFALLWLASLALSLANAAPLVLAIAALAFLADFVLVLPLWRFAASEGTPGAGDNLAASAATMEMLKELKARRDEGRGLQNTRVIFISFDAEEAGLRGARAWARDNAGRIAEKPSWHYNMDCLYSARDARFLTSDINGSVRLSAPLAQACAEAAREAGVEAAVEPIAFLTGGTDAAETAKAGVRATTLIAMQWSNEERSSVYHTPADDVSAVEPAAVELAIRVGLRLAERLDAGELD